jgi:hypothetical protein
MSKDRRGGYALARDHNILDHLATFRVTMRDVIARRFFAGHTPSAAKKVLNRLERRGLIRSFRYTLTGAKLWMLTSAGCYLLGVSDKLARPLKTQALARRLALTAFLHVSGPQMHRVLTATELDSAAPGASSFDPQATYYLDDADGTRRIALIVIDYGSLDARRVARKCLIEIRARFDHPGFRRLVIARLLQVTVLTSTAEKAQRVRTLLGEEGKFPFRVEFVRELNLVLGV